MKPNCKWLNRGLCFSWVKMSRGGLWFCSPVMPWFWVNFFAVLLVFLSWLQDGCSSSKHIFFTWQCLYVASLKGMPETEACVQCLGEVIIGSRSKDWGSEGGEETAIIRMHYWVEQCCVWLMSDPAGTSWGVLWDLCQNCPLGDQKSSIF